MVLEILASVSHFAATTPAIVGICLGATLFLVGIMAVTAFFYRRKQTTIYRKSGVYLTNRSPISEEIPLRSQLILSRRKSDASIAGNRTPHLVMKKSPSPPFATPSPKNISPVTPPTDEGGNTGGRKSLRGSIAIQSNPICNTATFCELHSSGKCTHGPRSSNHLVKRENSKSPRTSPQISPSTSTPANLSSQHDVMNQRNGNSSMTDTCTINISGPNLVTSLSSAPSPTPTPVTCQNAATLESVVASTSNNQKLTGGGQNDLGILHFKIRYKEEKGTLVVTVVKCEDLPSGLPVKDTAFYVKLQLLPEKQRVKTRVLTHTRAPIFEEDFSFYGVRPNQIQGISLHFVVLSFDRYSRDEVIGEVCYPLEELDVSGSDNFQMDIAMDIQPRNFKMQTQGRGEVLLSLCWQPTANRLTVVVLKARNLPKMDLSGLADPYVKLYLQFDGQRLVKKKTHVKKRTLNPVFNESFVFDLPPAAAQSTNLDKLSLQVLLLDWDRVTKNEVIGRLELGSGATSPTATHHWNEVLNCPRRQIAEWHKLRD